MRVVVRTAAGTLLAVARMCLLFRICLFLEPVTGALCTWTATTTSDAWAGGNDGYLYFKLWSGSTQLLTTSVTTQTDAYSILACTPFRPSALPFCLFLLFLLGLPGWERGRPDTGRLHK